VTISQGLADILGFKVGDSASILASTIHGQANAADVDITDTVNTGNVATNDKLMLMPLAMAQSLMDAPGRAELLTVLAPADDPAANRSPAERMLSMYTQEAPGERQSNALRDGLAAEFKQAGLDLEVRTWQEMSAFYRQVKSMYDMIFALMLCVVLAIVVLSIANAMSMAVVERTREIGTLRAIGVRRSGIANMFISEALMLVLVGTVVGLALMALTRLGVNAADIRYVPPGNTVSVPVFIGFDAARTALAAGVLAVLAVAAAFVPARRAARQPIIESLGHV
jgi:putative ABC transport system permease protein